MILPFDPIVRAREVEDIVMRGDARRYYRFRHANFYGPNGIITADASGCNLLCAYCWNYFRNEDPLRFNDLGFLGAIEVSKKLQGMGKSHHCQKFRISGCEPFLGEASTQHLASIIKYMPSANFIIETNGLMLGYCTSLIRHLVDLDNVQLRVAVKADNPASFERITGAKGEFQAYQLKAISELKAEEICVSVAFMDQFVNPTLLGFGYGEDYDSEDLKYYKGTTSRLIQRGVLCKPTKPSKHVYKPEKPKEAIYWEDKGDIT